MSDPRVEAYARLLVERSIDPRPGAQVLVSTTTNARPLAEELSRQLARRGAYALTRMSVGAAYPVDAAWIGAAPSELAGGPRPARAGGGRSRRRTRSTCSRPTTRPSTRTSRPSSGGPCARSSWRTGCRAARAARPRSAATSPARGSPARLASRSPSTRTSSTPPACATGTPRARGCVPSSSASTLPRRFASSARVPI